ncbi:MAG: bifunctional riboflavin kinase/FAD synthetase [Actinomycetota bacterium]|nr:bifunctional riboflavin kinase/FAD synthetase [Actinomycetota bacterium]
MFTGNPNSWNEQRNRYAVAVGVFDGVHRGHKAVFDAVRQASGGLELCALTFGSHPATVVADEPAPLMLMTLDRRLQLLDEVGIEAVAVIDFDNAVRHLSPRAFVEVFLTGALNADLVAVGRGFRFGYQAEGTVDHLRLLGQKLGFDVVEAQIVNLHGTEVRSSSIRASIAMGSVELAARMLGRPFEIAGAVVEGDRRGRTIGFPTANITMPEGVVRPAGGVYAVRCLVDGSSFDGVCNVGTRPTFGGGEESIEVHLYDIDVDLYGKTVLVEFIDRIRDEQRFDSVEALVAQIKVDIGTAKTIFG